MMNLFAHLLLCLLEFLSALKVGGVNLKKKKKKHVRVCDKCDFLFIVSLP